MGLEWRRAFCTTIPKDQENRDLSSPSPSPSPSPKFKFFSSSSNPSTPRLQPHQLVSNPNPNSSVTLRCRTTTPSPPPPPPQVHLESPKPQCETTKNSPRLFSPRSRSTFSLLKSSLGNSKKEFALKCPVCGSVLEEPQVVCIHTVTINNNLEETKSSEFTRNNTKIKPNVTLKVYNDDEPLTSPHSGIRFNPIPESDEENESLECGRFFSNSVNGNGAIEVTLLPEVAVISAGRNSETYAMVMKVKAPPTLGKGGRAPIDLVAVIDVSTKMNDEKLQMMKKAMRIVLSSLSGEDRLSIVAFSSTSKRLFPLRRMTTSGRRSARRIVEAMVAIEGTQSSSVVVDYGTKSSSVVVDYGTKLNSMDALKKAVKVLEDRRERNPASRILLLSEDRSSSFSHLEIPVHAIGLGQGGACSHADSEEVLAKSIGNVLSVVVQDLSVRLGFISGSAPGEISAVYESMNRTRVLGSGSIRVGELYAEEETEFLVELKVPSASRAHRVLSVGCSYKDPLTQGVVNCKEQSLLVPRPLTANVLSVRRMRSRFITLRALVEARRLIERDEFCGAHHMLASARALLLQTRPGSGSGSSLNDEFICELDVELSELSRKKLSQKQEVPKRGLNVGRDVGNRLVCLDEKAEPLTPTSAWRAAEKLARLAVMRKSMNKVSDLHGFENARF